MRCYLKLGFTLLSSRQIRAFECFEYFHGGPCLVLVLSRLLLIVAPGTLFSSLQKLVPGSCWRGSKVASSSRVIAQRLHFGQRQQTGECGAPRNPVGLWRWRWLWLENTARLMVDIGRRHGHGHDALLCSAVLLTLTSET